MFRLGGPEAFWKFHAIAFANQRALAPERARAGVRTAERAHAPRGWISARVDMQSRASQIVPWAGIAVYLVIERACMFR